MLSRYPRLKDNVQKLNIKRLSLVVHWVARSDCRSARWRSFLHRVRSLGTSNKTFIFHKLDTENLSHLQKGFDTIVQHASIKDRTLRKDWQPPAFAVASIRHSIHHLRPPVPFTAAGLPDGIEREYQSDDATWFSQHRHPSDLPSAAFRSKRLPLQQLFVQHHRLQKALHGSLQAALQSNGEVC